MTETKSNFLYLLGKELGGGGMSQERHSRTEHPVLATTSALCASCTHLSLNAFDRGSGDDAA